MDSQSWNFKFNVTDEIITLNSILNNLLFRCGICARAICCIPLDRIVPRNSYKATPHVTKESPVNDLKHRFTIKSKSPTSVKNPPSQRSEKSDKNTSIKLLSDALQNSTVASMFSERKLGNSTANSLFTEKKLQNSTAASLSTGKKLKWDTSTFYTGSKSQLDIIEKKCKRKKPISFRLFRNKARTKSANIVSIVKSALKWVRDSETNIENNKPHKKLIRKIKIGKFNKRQNLTVLTFCTKYDRNDSAGDCPEFPPIFGINESDDSTSISISLDNSETIMQYVAKEVIKSTSCIVNWM